MALVIEKTIDLTTYEGNSEPKIVKDLSIIHEASDGELVQYYIDPKNSTEGDKNTHAIGVFDKDSKTWSYKDYDEVTWGRQGQRIAGNRIERLGVKAFPDVGAIAFYKLASRDVSRIVAPVNRKNEKTTAPALKGTVNADGTITFTITPPESPEYSCYRIVMSSGDFAEDHMTYDLTVIVPAPLITGAYECYAIGYLDEGQICSKDSNAITLSLKGAEDMFSPPYFTKGEIKKLDDRITSLETTGLPEAASSVLNGREEPASSLGSDGQLYIQWAYASEE